MAKICPACQHENPDGALFCKECGTPLPEESSYEALWYIQDRGEMKSVREAELVEMIKNGQIKAESTIWSEGMPDWQSVQNTSLALYLPEKEALSTSTSFSSTSLDPSTAPAVHAAPAMDEETTAKRAARAPYIEPMDKEVILDDNNGTVKGAVFYQDPISPSREHKVLSRKRSRTSQNDNNGVPELSDPNAPGYGSKRVSAGKTAEQIREEELFSQPVQSTQQQKVQDRAQKREQRERSTETPYMPFVFEMIEMAALLFLVVGGLLFFLTGGLSSESRIWSLVLTVIGFVYIVSIPITNSVFISYFKRHSLPKSYKSLATGQIILNILPVVLVLCLFFLTPGFLAELLALL